jgi:hypothetical protein
MAMTFPLFTHDLFGYGTSAALAGLIGFFFGFVLERAGFGKATILAAQFYLRNMRVFKVMFSAVVTAALGLALLSGVGLLDMAAITIPKAYIWPQIVGGLVMGAGFVISGYCPGTSVVAAASGNRDGVVAYVGIIVGSMIFGFAFPLLEGFYLSGPLNEIRLPELLSVPDAVLAAGVLVMAVGAFFGAEKVEKIFATRDKTEPPPAAPRLRNASFMVLGAIAVAGLITIPLGKSEAARAPKPKAFQSVQPIALAELLVTKPGSVTLLDLREKAQCEERTIPTAVCKPAAEFSEDFVATGLQPTRTVVLFNGATIDQLPGHLDQFEGQILVVSGGFDAFRDQLLTPPNPPANPTQDALADYRLRSSLHAYFTGSRAPAKAVKLAPRKVTRTLKKGGGC